MDGVIIAILIGIFIIGFIWIFMSSRSVLNVKLPDVKILDVGSLNNINIKNEPFGKNNGNVTIQDTNLSDKTVSNVFQNFASGLFSRAYGEDVDMNNQINDMVKILCKDEKEEIKMTLNEYVKHLTKLMKSYKPGKMTSEWSSNSQTSDRSFTESESNDEIKYLCGKLNSIFSECVTYNNGDLGIFFGVLCTNLLGCSMALRKDQLEKAEEIKKRMFEHIKKIM